MNLHRFCHIFWKTPPCRVMKQVPILIVLVMLAFLVNAEVRYSIPEEMMTGTFIGNIAKDLGLDNRRLKTGKARIYNERGSEYVELDAKKGILIVKNRIDREQMCGRKAPCSLNFQIVLDNPMELHRVSIDIVDINDNVPTFDTKNIELKIIESSLPGAEFSLPSAVDSDAGVNSLKSYILTPNDHFRLKIYKQTDGSSSVNLLLESPLDREMQEELVLLLTAFDGGEPQRSGTAEIRVVVVDANDNAPVFTDKVYKASVMENCMIGSVLIRVTATDADKGVNGEVQYFSSQISQSVHDLFEINPDSGEITVKGPIDYETNDIYEMTIEARDYGGHVGSSKVVIEVIDVNDNVPFINIMSVSSQVSEDALPGTVIAMINVQDRDSGRNGNVKCFIDNNDIPFKLKSSLNNFYGLETNGFLDREKISLYNIGIIAADEGEPSLSATHTITLEITDVNDNAPTFERQHYTTYVMENNSPGSSFFSVRAKDDDLGLNRKISYFIQETGFNNISVSSIISINSEDGVIYAVRSFDYELLTHFQVSVTAKDGGTPPLSTDVFIDVFVQDQNDNPPEILYPVFNKGIPIAEFVPRSADFGYLVTKVVAVDKDSGQNAWLSYKIVKSTDQTLFEIGLNNGELRTLRKITEKDATKQRLTVMVEDSGQTSQSATVNVNIAITDNVAKAFSEFIEFTMEKDGDNDLKFYLVLALVIVCFVFVIFIIVLITLKLHKWRRSKLFNECSSGTIPVIPYYPPRYAEVGATGTLCHVYNYEVCLTTDSGDSEFKYVKSAYPSATDLNHSGTLKKRRISESDIIPDEDKNEEVNPAKIQGSQNTTLNHLCQKPANAEWRFTQGQRPGTSGTQRPEEAGPWPNPPTEAEQLQALMAAANEVSEATGTLGAGTMGLSTRYSPQFTLQHVPDYRQNVYIPGSTTTLAGNNAQPDAKIMAAAAPTASKKKPGKKEKK
ncbi:protocadherin gamma-A2-like isoform X1 [Polypterus senegalus]|uniref:protocadherin gamma-A2-like isoform X1 n=1 Tax=Polypterus senegalus TaxID=55291 RepID=UPI0019649CC8|nr:protocadherin gamma-A2-like isoform X1 [Polypterus senegalus]